MLLDIGIYQLDIDVSRTEAYHCKEYSIGCDCDGCCNFEQAIHLLPSDAKEFFRLLGVDPRKPAEVSALVSSDGTDICYDGFYHICGTIPRGTSPWIQTGPRQQQLDEQYVIRLPSDFSFFFTEDCHLLPEDFPRPAIQMHFTGYLPWILKKDNPYLYSK